MSYITVKEYGEASFEEKKSEFIGYAKRVNTEEEAKEFVNEIKSKHKQARHNCFAYVIGQNMGIQRYSDDGEPQGTAGIPILEVMKKSGITDCAVVVTRYFGGILLGAGGLTRAYTKAASMAVKEAGVIEKVDGLKLTVKIEYDLLGKVQYLCAKNSWHIEEIQYMDYVELFVFVETSSVEVMEKEITNLTSGKAEMVRSEEGIYFKEGDRLYNDKSFNC
jgi:uncharacterized YigZ family protein